jgi:site-specific DNA-methyltransferase (adenine-specific)
MRGLGHVVFKSQTPEWATPRAVYEDLNAEFHFDFDPCPLGGSEDGLASLFCSWRGRRVFCNPPYTNIARWLERAKEADVAVFLLPARTDTQWFHDALATATEIRFVRRRLTFGDQPNPAPFPSVVIIYIND